MAPILLLVPATALAATFYVDGASPSCSDSGPGTEAVPYCTISAAIAAHNGPDVTLLVAPALYDEGVTVPRAGASERPFVLRAMGPGVVLSGGITLSGRPWVVVDGFTLHGTLHIGGSSNTVITHNTVIGGQIYVSNLENLHLASNSTSGYAGHGIHFRGVAQSLIEDNESFGNVNGIYLSSDGYHTESNVIRRNRFHDNSGTGMYFTEGIWYGTMLPNDLSIQNLCWRNGDHGILHVTGGSRHIGDVVWGNGDDGISIKCGTLAAVAFSNCIAGDNGLGHSAYNLYVDSTSVGALVSDDNLFWNSNGQKPIRYGNVTYTSVAAFSAATGLDTRTLQADPRFVDPAGGDFHLLPGSPAIDSGNSGVADWPTLDADGQPRLDDGMTSNTGMGPVDYGERGAFEYLGTPLAVQPATLSGLTLAAPAPNPVRGTVRFLFTTFRAAPVRLTVLDTQGRTIARLADHHGEAGRHEVIWDGLTGGGRATPGLYFVRLESMGRSLVRRFTIVQ